jgi:hypothetical protein
LALLLAAAYITRDPSSGHDLAGTTGVRTQTAPVLRNLVAFAAHFTLALPFAIPWLFLRYAQLRRVTSLLALLGGALLPVMAGEVGRLWWLAPASALGTWAIVDALADAIRRRDNVALALASTLFIALPAAFYAHLPPKYLVPAAPQAGILLAEALPAQNPRLARLLIGPTLVVGVTLGALILRADDALSEIGRRAGEVVTREVTKGQRVWCDGWWGFQWYAERSGARPLTWQPPFAGRDDIVVSGYGSRVIDSRYPRKRPLELHRFAEAGGRVLQVEAGAGFYSNNFGYLPWAWSRDTEIGHIAVWRIQ